MKRVPFYLSPGELAQLVQALFTLQHILSVTHSGEPVPESPLQLLQKLRRQCCVRSGVPDPIPELPLGLSIFDDQSTRQRRRKIA